MLTAGDAIVASPTMTAVQAMSTQIALNSLGSNSIVSFSLLEAQNSRAGAQIVRAANETTHSHLYPHAPATAPNPNPLTLKHCATPNKTLDA